MEPATGIIEAMGGTRAVSEIAGVHISQINKWTWPKERGGSDGVIPMKHAMSLVAHARLNGMSLTPNHFFPEASKEDQTNG
jgi:hypothetical protein